jgi:hypothetical protein
MKRPLAPLLLLSLALAGAAQAQVDVRVRGSIAAFDGTLLTVTAVDGRSVTAAVTADTGIVYTRPIALSDIRPGDFLGVTSHRSPDGTLTAYEIRRFPKPVNPGHRPFEGRDDQTMTNATVSATVQATGRNELTLTYPDGAQKVTVDPKAFIASLAPGERSQLVPGAPITLTAGAGADGRLIAQRIQVGPPR